MHCAYYGVPKGIPWAEVMSNSEKSSLYPLAIIELRLSEESVSQSVSQ